ncbi:hypothetical protein D9611_004572 [Ephemerocybe angulata]|uniref:glucan 1,3-beta-glucosidase n=1 Tax=Ephemerocybe angulata TaxID=980116 RepID=A0A8H5BJP6_9AGAR|nr:hypothetical protein D9611_004572 [Tulosesus angulatus]
MANPGQPSGNIVYDPLPLTTEDSNALYNAPPSPLPSQSQFSMNDGYSGVPPGAGQPRFMAAQLYGGNDTSQPDFRDSFASSNRSIPGGNPSEYGSVYALNDTRSGPYRDEPAGFPDDVPMSPVGHSRALNEKNNVYAPPKAKSRRKIMIIGAIIALILIAAAVVIPLYFTVFKKKDGSSSGKTGDSTGSNTDSDSTGGKTPNKPQNVVSGGDGSTVTMEDGTTFKYQNKFGGYWYYDPNNPYSSGGKPQEWSPAINETFNYGVDKIRGVNIGGWLNPEPKYINNPTPAVDEWTLCDNMAKDTAGGGLNQLEDHYKTFITEKDFAEIAAAGLNYIRLPIGFWAVEKRANEPFLEGVSWKYALKAFAWARKYGLRINLDLHTAPGSQNGWNHSGKMGTVGFLNGPMGYANAQRMLNIVRIIAEFISQPQYKDVVTMFGVMNEPQASVMGQDALFAFYLEAYNIVRTAGGGTGDGKGPWVSMHDGFLGRDKWTGAFPNADRVTLDSHPYMCFGGQSADPITSFVNTPCTSWASSTNDTMSNFGLFNAGEFSNAVNDCGLFLNEVNGGSRYEGDYIRGTFPRVGSCTTWTDYASYTPAMKDGLKKFAMASMDALQNYFFWTWKIGPSAVSGKVEAPAWSYQLGLQEGWMPEDPREAAGACGNTNPWQPPLKPGTGSIPAAYTQQYAWPPAEITKLGAPAALPAYTPTGTIITLAPSTVTAAKGETITKTADPGSGWNNAADQDPLYVEIAGCTYLDPWVNPDTAAPAPCGGSGAARRMASPITQPTAAPSLT